jgi:DNA primase
VQSVSVIPNQILRDTYIHDCAQRIGINEGTLINQMNNFIRSRNSATPGATQAGISVGPAPQPNTGAQPSGPAAVAMQPDKKVERMIAQMLVRHGEKVIY